MNEQISLFSLWMEQLQDNNQTKNCCQQKTYNYSMNQQPNWLDLVLHRDSFVFYFGFYFMSPKWTKTKIVIGITLSLQA